MTGRIFFLTISVLLLTCSVKEDRKVIRVGNYQNRPRGFHSVYMPEGQIAVFIDNNIIKPVKIQNIRYFIGTKGDYSKPFRVMLYAVDSISGKPNRELLPDTVLVRAEVGNGWCEVNVSEYDLTFPDNGVIASMKWVPDDDFNEVSQTECQYLAYNKINNKNITWYCALGINWYQLPDCNYNAMISIEVK